MPFKQTRSTIRTIKKGNPNFTITDGIVQAQRAGFEISQNCPKEYRSIISVCIDRGWLNPVAHMTEKELIFNGLSKD